MKNSINVLPIQDELRLKLVTLLTEFESYRVGNDLTSNSKEEIKPLMKVVKTENNKSTEPIQVVKRKKKRLSFLEKLFITEYAS